jgi:uncharacterized protein (TIGR04552 family)
VPDRTLDAEARLATITIGDLEAVRLLLRGGSVVDWHRLDLRDHNEVDRFLRVNEFDPQNAGDVQRLENLRNEAVEYLAKNFHFRIPDDIAERVPVRDLFLIASKKTKRQMYACIVLKVMHIIHHLDGRELIYRLPVPEQSIFRLVEAKVVRMVEEIRGAGHHIVEFEWSRKPRDSLITKLMAKRSTLAASVYDKIRFRLVTKDEKGIMPMLIELLHRLIPFNYVVPGESVNGIINLRRLVEESPALGKLAPGLQQDIGLEDEGDDGKRSQNEFSGPGYRIINFAVDMPVRLDQFEPGAIGFVLTEFQIVDEKTANQNEQGENSHELYKERQRQRVKQRLLRGLNERPATPSPDDTRED